MATYGTLWFFSNFSESWFNLGSRPTSDWRNHPLSRDRDMNYSAIKHGSSRANRDGCCGSFFGIFLEFFLVGFQNLPSGVEAVMPGRRPRFWVHSLAHGRDDDHAPPGRRAPRPCVRSDQAWQPRCLTRDSCCAAAWRCWQGHG